MRFAKMVVETTTFFLLEQISEQIPLMEDYGLFETRVWKAVIVMFACGCKANLVFAHARARA